MSKGSASPITLPRLRGALHPLEALPGGDGWNRDELSDLLVPDSSVAAAAVLVPLVPRESSLGVLLTRRTDALRHHPGQVSFPGARVEDADPAVVASALPAEPEEVWLASATAQPAGSVAPPATATGTPHMPVAART